MATITAATVDVGANGQWKAAQGTITADKQAWNSTATWNSSGVTFVHLKANVTDTASAAASLLIDLQVGGVSQFKVSKAGLITAAGGVTCAVLTPTHIATATTTEMYRGATDGRIIAFSRALGATKFGVHINSDIVALMPSDTFAIANDGTKGFHNRTTFGNDGGMFLVTNITDGQCAMFLHSGTTMVEVGDPSSTFSITQGTANSNNVSFVANVLTIENKRGSSKTYTITYHGG